MMVVRLIKKMTGFWGFFAHKSFVLTSILGFTLATFLSLGCQRSPNQIAIEVDRGQLILTTHAKTVREVLNEANIKLGELDRVKPDLNYQLKPVMTIEVIRVEEHTESLTQTIPYRQRTIVNEALAPGERRLAQPGQNGLETIMTTAIYENGVEVERTQVDRMIVHPPVDELIVVGRRDDLPPAQIEGILVYISGGNAWMMKDNNASRRLLTTEGDLDGRVFDLSPDGKTLLYSRTVTDSLDAPLNEVWLVNTLIVGEKPVSTPLKGVLYAEWSPNITQSQIAFSTAERSAGQPGWRANNDLWLWDPRVDLSEATQVISPNTSSLYAWWGRNYAWSPDGRYIGFADAGQIGVVDILSQTIITLIDFVPYNTKSDWVWVPTISWSLNSRFIATTIHGPPIQNEPIEDSPRFDVWLLAVDTIGDGLKVQVAENTGMWSNPVWHAHGISFGQATTPLKSVNSRYKLMTMDWDGSNERLRFPMGEEPGMSFPELAWTQTSSDLVFTYRDNIYLLSEHGTPPQALTSDSQSHRPQWTVPTTLTIQPSLTLDEPVTNTASITPNGQISPIVRPFNAPALRVTPSITPAGLISNTNGTAAED